MERHTDINKNQTFIPLAILISRAVRINAISVELKCTVLSSATGKSIRNSLCGANQGGLESVVWHLYLQSNKFTKVEGAPLLKEQKIIFTLPKMYY